MRDRGEARAKPDDRSARAKQDRHLGARQLRRRGPRGDRCARGQGIPVDYLRVRAFPFSQEVESFLHAHRRCFRGGAESRCTAALAADARNSRRQVQAQINFELQRHPHVLGAHRRRDARDAARAASPGAARLTAVQAAKGTDRQSGPMSFINKPKVAHPSLPTNAFGLTRRQYEGAKSTLCAGCGHDSITAAIVEACWGLDIRRTW